MVFKGISNIGIKGKCQNVCITLNMDKLLNVVNVFLSSERDHLSFSEKALQMTFKTWEILFLFFPNNKSYHVLYLHRENIICNEMSPSHYREILSSSEQSSVF